MLAVWLVSLWLRSMQTENMYRRLVVFVSVSPQLVVETQWLGCTLLQACSTISLLPLYCGCTAASGLAMSDLARLYVS